MAAKAEPRSDAGEFKRRSQEYLPQIITMWGVVPALARRILKPHRTERLLSRGELCGEHSSGAHRAPSETEGFINDSESISATKIAVKVQIAAENVGKLDCDVVGNSRSIRGGEQRRPDLARLHLDSASQFDRFVESLETFSDAVEREQRISLGEVPERAQLAALIDLRLDDRSRSQQAKGAHGARGAQDQLRVFLVRPEPGEKAHGRFVAPGHTFLHVDARAGIAGRCRGERKRLDNEVGRNGVGQLMNSSERGDHADQRNPYRGGEPVEAPSSRARYNSVLAAVLHVSPRIEPKKSSK